MHFSMLFDLRSEIVHQHIIFSYIRLDHEPMRLIYPYILTSKLDGRNRMMYGTGFVVIAYFSRYFVPFCLFFECFEIATPISKKSR